MKFSHCCWWDGPEASNNVSTVDWAINLAVILCIVKVEHAGSFLTPYFETIYQTFFYLLCLFSSHLNGVLCPSGHWSKSHASPCFITQLYRLIDLKQSDAQDMVYMNHINHFCVGRWSVRLTFTHFLSTLLSLRSKCFYVYIPVS